MKDEKDRRFEVRVIVYDVYQEEVVDTARYLNRNEITELIREFRNRFKKNFYGIIVVDRENHKEYVYGADDRIWKTYTI